MLHSSTADPFKLALYKLIGKIDPARRSVAQVTVTTEDWLWFQLAMVRLTSGTDRDNHIDIYYSHRWMRTSLAACAG